MGIENLQPGSTVFGNIAKRSGGLVGRVILNVGNEFPLTPAQRAQFQGLKDQLARRNYAAYFVAVQRSAEILRDLGKPKIEEVYEEIVDPALKTALDQMELVRAEVANPAKKIEYAPDRSIARLHDGAAPISRAFPASARSAGFEADCATIGAEVARLMEARRTASAGVASVPRT